MNWNRVEGNWKQAAGAIRKKWGELTDDDLDVIEGNRDMLAGKLQERYGIALDQAHGQITQFADQFRRDETADGHQVSGGVRNPETEGDPPDRNALSLGL